MHRTKSNEAKILRGALSAVLALALASTAAAQQPSAQPAAAVTDPSALAVLETNPQTPSELLRAATVLIDLNQAAAAAPLVDKLRQANLDDAALAALVREVGSPALLKLSLAADLQPGGNEFADTALAAAERVRRDPARLAALIQQLGAATEAERFSALTELRLSQDVAAAALVAVLADSSRQPEHDRVRHALVACGASANGPIIAGLASSEMNLEVQLVQAVVELGDPRLAIYLLAPAAAPASARETQVAATAAVERLIGSRPTAADAAATLYRQAQHSLETLPPRATEGAMPETVWTWDAAARAPVSAEAPPRLAALDRIARLLADARRILPSNADIRRLYYSTAIEAQAAREDLAALDPAGGAPSDARTALAELGDEDLAVSDDLLAHSQEARHSAAALAAIYTIASRATRDILYSNSPQPCALVRSLGHPDRHVRFAAARAIMALAHDAPYPGASFLTDALEFFMATSGAPRALAADLRASEAARLASLLMVLGFEAEAVTDGRTLIHRATSSADLDLVVIDYYVAAPATGQLIRELRLDSRTALVPVAIVASSDELAAAQRLAAGFARTSAIVRPQDEAGLDVQIRAVLDRYTAGAISHEERQAQAAAALGWAIELSQSQPSIYQLQRLEEAATQAIWLPQLSASAAELLSNLGTATAQQTLVDVASLSTQDAAVRQAAAGAFARAVARDGTLLTTAQIMAQYQRYNQSQSLDRNTQAILGSILDVIEAAAQQNEPAVGPHGSGSSETRTEEQRNNSAEG